MSQDATAPRHGRLLGLLFAGVLVAALDIAMVGPALPALRRHFGVDARATSWVFSAYVLATLVGMPLMAKLSDRWGRRAAYQVDLACLGLGSLVVASAPSFAALLAGRAIQGFGAGGIFPVAAATVGDVVAPDRRGRALGLLGAVWGLAFLIGPIVGGLLLLVGWRWLFIVNLPLVVLVMAASWRILPSAAAPVRAPFDAAGLALSSAAMALLVWGLSALDVKDGGSLADPWPWGALALAAVLLAAFLAVERRAADPILRPSFFRSRQVRLAAVLAVGAGVGESGVVFIPALVTGALGVSHAKASFMLLPLVASLAVGSPLFGRALDRRGSRAVLLAGTVLTMAAMLALGVGAFTMASFYVESCLVGLGLAALLGGAPRYVMLAEAHADERTSTQGVLAVCMSTGQLVGAAVTGAVAGSAEGVAGQGYARAFVVLGIAMAGFAAAAAGLKGREAERAGLAAAPRGP